MFIVPEKPERDIGTLKEAMLLFFVTGLVPSPTVAIASNCQCEVWSRGKYVGPGGDRCSGAKVFSRQYAVEPGHDLVVRVHWINSTSVTCRRTFPVPFIWVGDDAAVVTASVELGFAVGARACSQLPCQTAYFPQAAGATAPVVLCGAPTYKRWAVVPAVTRDLVVIPTPAVLKASTRGKAVRPRTSLSSLGPLHLPCLHTYAFAHIDDLKHYVYDLGQIASHRYEITTGPDAPCIVLPAEVATLSQMRTSNRSKTKLADFIASSCKGRVFGRRGCRYLHVFQDKDCALPATIAAFRLEYPFAWKTSAVAKPGAEAIAAAVKRNLVAVVGSDIVDTCWREDTLWTGDATVALRVLSDLADNREIALHATAQIAETYNEELGMVASIVPVPAHTALYIPSYHLLFCLLLGQLEPHEVAPEAARVIMSSMAFWREHYVVDGLLTVPGTDRRVWHFIDWTSGASCRDSGAGGTNMQCNAVLNSLWVQLHQLFCMPDHGIDLAKYEELFACPSLPGAYSMTPGTNKPHVHATTNTMLAGLAPDVHRSGVALSSLLDEWGPACKLSPSDFAHGGPTAFYAAFVCDALQLWDPRAAFDFAVRFYGPMAAKYGTLIEKKVDNASLAHSWSVGVARTVFQTV